MAEPNATSKTIANLQDELPGVEDVEDAQDDDVYDGYLDESDVACDDGPVPHSNGQETGIIDRRHHPNTFGVFRDNPDLDSSRSGEVRWRQTRVEES